MLALRFYASDPTHSAKLPDPIKASVYHFLQDGQLVALPAKGTFFGY